MQDKNTTSVKALAEQAFADDMILASSHSDAVKNRWFSAQSAHRFLAHVGKKLVVYTTLFEQPEIHSTWECEDLKLSATLGLYSIWSCNDTRRSLIVYHLPVELADGCFLWHPSSSGVEVRRHGRHDNNTMTVSSSILLKQPLNPLKRRSHAGLSVMEYGQFHNTYLG